MTPIDDPPSQAFELDPFPKKYGRREHGFHFSIAPRCPEQVTCEQLGTIYMYGIRLSITGTLSAPFIRLARSRFSRLSRSDGEC